MTTETQHPDPLDIVAALERRVANFENLVRMFRNARRVDVEQALSQALRKLWVYQPTTPAGYLYAPSTFVEIPLALRPTREGLEALHAARG